MSSPKPDENGTGSRCVSVRFKVAGDSDDDHGGTSQIIPICSAMTTAAS